MRIECHPLVETKPVCILRRSSETETEKNRCTVHTFFGPRELLDRRLANSVDGLESADAAAGSEASAVPGPALVPQSISRTRKG